MFFSSVSHELPLYYADFGVISSKSDTGPTVIGWMELDSYLVIEV